MRSLDGIMETALYADDLNAARDFYAGILGLLQVDYREGVYVFFRCANQMLLLFNPQATRIQSTIPTHGAKGPGHVCFRVGEDQLAAWKRHVMAQRIPIESEVDWPNGVRSFYVRDPANNSVEFSSPNLWGLQ